MGSWGRKIGINGGRWDDRMFVDNAVFVERAGLGQMYPSPAFQRLPNLEDLLSRLPVDVHTSRCWTDVAGVVSR